MLKNKGQLKEHEEKSKKNNNQILNSNSLANQLKEKQFEKQNIRVQEKAIAKQYMQEADKYRQELEDEKARKQRQKEDYYKALSNQIHENKKKKQYSVLMTEHERRVNDRDIKAYEYQDTHNLYSKVPGFGGDNRLEKYIDKSMHINGSNQGSPVKTASKANALDTSSERGSNLAKMGQATLNRSNNIINNNEESPPRGDGNPYTIHKLQKVRDNMEKEDAFKYRANTLNRAYGFEQRNKHNPPTTKLIGRRDMTNPYEYNFVAPGNY